MWMAPKQTGSFFTSTSNGGKDRLAEIDFGIRLKFKSRNVLNRAPGLVNEHID